MKQPTMRLIVCTLAVLAMSAVALAQWNGYGRSRYPPRFRPEGQANRGFSFCRMMYRSDRRELAGRGWSTDYPYADINFMIRLSEMTFTQVDFDRHGEPNHWVVDIMDDELFRCPFLMTSDVGTMYLTDQEVPRLREYLVKGGFLWVDDFWGSLAWTQWASEIGRVLPPGDYPIVDVPLTHDVFRTQFNIWEIPQISNIGFWRRSGRTTTSERGPDSAIPHFRAILDDTGRIMVAMTHNTDIQDSWEREAEDELFFETFSPNGYALGINVLLYAMAH